MTNSDILVDWLQRATADEREREAADTILSLKSEIEALREALEAIDKSAFIAVSTDSDETAYVAVESIHDIARAALSGSPEG